VEIMRTFLDAKAMAKALRSDLEKQKISISHSQSLELVAKQFNCSDWNELAAKMAASNPGDAIRFNRTSPIFRIFDEAKAKEFYVDFLGFTLDWEHRFDENSPLYAVVSRAGLSVRLSAHHGDASPGSQAFVVMQGIQRFQAELVGKNYVYAKPAIDETEWGLMMTVTDPFSNRIQFIEQPGQ
jgi:catechol 2,3-dioxygenase-like lactoylglutathione lyase family enzyme